MPVSQDKKRQIERRRRIVATHWVRGFTLGEIANAVAEAGIVNRNGDPFSRATIHSDVEAIRDEWRAQRKEDIDEWVAHELAVLNQIEREAWRSGDIRAVLSASSARRQMLGLDAPREHTMTLVDNREILELIPRLIKALEALGLSPAASFEQMVQEAERKAKALADGR